MMESLNKEDIVITGVSGVFPKANNLEEFSTKLFAKENLLSSVPYMPCKLGKIKDLSKFDAEFFGFQPHRVEVMDPMARIILEKAYETIIDSGNNPVTFKGKNCGVFVGIHFLETEMLVYEKLQKGASLAISRSFNANRISYWLGVHGPSFTVDSACSSTLLALEMGYKAIKNGECDSAIVGGCHVCLHPALLLHLLKVGALNPDGESRVFDENAGGFCKAEAIGLFYLQKAQDAKRVYAKVLNVRSNHDGSKKLFLSPHGPSQAKLLKMAYEEIGIDVNSVSWVEAHATGTLVGDKQEVTAIDEVFKSRNNPLLIGSVKSNMGHAEAAAGVGSLSKVLIAMETGYIPPNINITNIRKDIEAFQSGRIKVVTNKTPWNGGIVGVSGFGMGGANTHVILKSFDKQKFKNGLPNDDLPRVIGISGRTEEAVELILNYLQQTDLDAELIALLHEVYNFNIPLHPLRGYVIVDKQKSCKIKEIKNFKTTDRPLWFVCSGFTDNIKQTYHYLKNIEVFEASIIKCHEILKSVDMDLMGSFQNDSNLESYICNAVIQIALYDLLSSLNVLPDQIIGGMTGSILCAYFDGSLSIHDTVMAIFLFSKYVNGNVTTEELHDSVSEIISSLSKSPKWIISSRLANESSEKSISIESFVKNSIDSSYFNDTIDGIPKNAIVLDFSTSKFTEVLKENLKGESVLISLTQDNVNDFLSKLGELYLFGKNPNFNKLYPSVEFPVSKSTKMLAPLVKWKHTTDWPVAFSSFQERMLSGEQKVSVSLDDKAYAFLAGHEIDSLVLFPGTGYLVLVWETLALIYGKMYSDLSVVFENIKFHRATIVPPKDPITFSIMVQKGNRNFEIIENNQLVVSGQIYVPANIKKEKLSIGKPADDDIVLDGLDFYRYILIRNYNYKGQFRSVKKINSQGTRSVVTWAKNWITYLDGVLHLLMLNGDTESLNVPVEIEKIVINVNKHEQLLQSSDEIEAIMDKNLNIIESGGVQIKGCALRPIPWRLNDKVPLVQNLSFIPYIFHGKKLPLKTAAYFFGQCLMDQLGQQAKDVKIIEVLDDDFNTNYSLFAPSLLSFIKEQPIFNAHLSVYVNNKLKLSKNGNGYEIIEGKLPFGEQVHFIICSKVLQNTKKLEHIVDSMNDNGFLVTRENSGFRISLPFHLHVCADVICNGERFLLLKKKIGMNLSSFKVIKTSNITFGWVEELQEALKIGLYERIILLAEKEPYNGILGFYNCLRLERETEKVRCFFILDDELESFSIENKFFRNQLLKDLAINIYKNEDWGCYIKQYIDELKPEKVYHAFVNRKNIGKKPSLQWSKGHIRSITEHDDDYLIQVFYASVNYTDTLLFKNRLATRAIVQDSLKQDYALGMEYSGKTKGGKRCMGLRSYGALSTLIEKDQNDIFFNEVPKNWSLEDAVTVPLAYYTVIHAFIVCGKLKNKDRVLIHSVGSFIGQAAIQIAMYYNCDIFVTISSVDEKLFIKENFPYIADSQIGYTDCSFEQMVFRETDGRGVDVVLNSLPEDRLLASINCLASNGRFIQIKKLDISGSGSYGNKLLSKNIGLYSAVLEDILKLPNEKKIALKKAVDEHIQNGAIKPLARTTYCYSGIDSAFEFASSARNLGKCVVQIEPEEERNGNTEIKLKNAYPRLFCNPQKIYIICGGLGGMGMELIHWLISRGARKILVTSRKGVTNGSQALRIAQWKSIGVQIHISQADISSEEQTNSLLDEANILGDVAAIFNLAAVLKDKMFKNQTAENFGICAGPKLIGTRNLDKLSRIKCPKLEYFVVFSSISSGYGNLGQTNYGMCNSALERICEQRCDDNLPALAIEWGAVGNVGMFVSFMDGNIQSSYAGNHMQPIKSCLDVLDYCMNQKSPVVASLILAEKLGQ